jgi:hypothetical protein
MSATARAMPLRPMNNAHHSPARLWLLVTGRPWLCSVKKKMTRSARGDHWRVSLIG